MFQTYIKNYQAKQHAKSWQQILQKREVIKNNYHVTGDIKKAKQFVDMVANVNFNSDERKTEEHVLFSPAYVFAIN